MTKIENGQNGVATSANNVVFQSNKNNCLDMIPINDNVPYSIGELIKKEADESGIVWLENYSRLYLSVKDNLLYNTLCKCTDGFALCGKIDGDGNVCVKGNERYHAVYDYDYAVFNVYQEMLNKMYKEVDGYMRTLIDDEDCGFRVWRCDNEEIYNTIIHFAGLYGISIYAGVECYNGYFVEGIGDEA